MSGKSFPALRTFNWSAFIAFFQTFQTDEFLENFWDERFLIKAILECICALPNASATKPVQVMSSKSVGLKNDLR